MIKCWSNIEFSANFIFILGLPFVKKLNVWTWYIWSCQGHNPRPLNPDWDVQFRPQTLPKQRKPYSPDWCFAGAQFPRLYQIRGGGPLYFLTNWGIWLGNKCKSNLVTRSVLKESTAATHLLFPNQNSNIKKMWNPAYSKFWLDRGMGL